MHTLNLPPCHCFCLHSVFSSSLTRGIGVGPDQLQGRRSEGIHGGQGPAMKPRMPGLCPWCGSLWPAWRTWGGILKMWTLHLQFVSFWNRWNMCASLGIWKNLITWLTFVVIQYFFEVFCPISRTSLAWASSNEGCERVSPTPSALPSCRGGLISRWKG